MSNGISLCNSNLRYNVPCLANNFDSLCVILTKVYHYSCVCNLSNSGMFDDKSSISFGYDPSRETPPASPPGANHVKFHHGAF